MSPAEAVAEVEQKAAEGYTWIVVLDNDDVLYLQPGDPTPPEYRRAVTLHPIGGHCKDAAIACWGAMSRKAMRGTQ